MAGSVALVVMIGGTVAINSPDKSAEEGHPSSNQTVAPGGGHSIGPAAADEAAPVEVSREFGVLGTQQTVAASTGSGLGPGRMPGAGPGALLQAPARVLGVASLPTAAAPATVTTPAAPAIAASPATPVTAASPAAPASAVPSAPAPSASETAPAYAPDVVPTRTVVIPTGEARSQPARRKTPDRQNGTAEPTRSAVAVATESANPQRADRRHDLRTLPSERPSSAAHKRASHGDHSKGSERLRTESAAPGHTPDRSHEPFL